MLRFMHFNHLGLPVRTLIGRVEADSITIMEDYQKLSSASFSRISI